MCPFFFSFSDQCVIQGQTPYMPLVEQRLSYCLNDNYKDCERYKLLSDPAVMATMERRQHRRVLRQVPGFAFDQQKRAEIETVDISMGGVRVRSTAYIPPGECVDMSLTPVQDRSVEAHGCVRWASPRQADGRWSLGIQFNPGLDSTTSQALEAIIWNGTVI